MKMNESLFLHRFSAWAPFLCQHDKGEGLHGNRQCQGGCKYPILGCKKEIYVGIECPHVCVLCIDPGPRCHGNFLGPFAGPVRVERMSELTKRRPRVMCTHHPMIFGLGSIPIFGVWVKN